MTSKDFKTLNQILDGFDIERKKFDTIQSILTIKFDEGKIDLESLEQTLEEAHLVYQNRKLNHSDKQSISKSDSTELCLDTIINGVCLDSIVDGITDEELGVRTDTIKL